MSKANPKKWFTSPIAKISFRKVGKWDERMAKHRPYFDTWEEAHQCMLDKAAKNFNVAKKAMASAERHLKKVRSMEPPKEAETLKLEVK